MLRRMWHNLFGHTFDSGMIDWEHSPNALPENMPAYGETFFMDCLGCGGRTKIPLGLYSSLGLWYNREKY